MLVQILGERLERVVPRVLGLPALDLEQRVDRDLAAIGHHLQQLPFAGQAVFHVLEKVKHHFRYKYPKTVRHVNRKWFCVPGRVPGMDNNKRPDLKKVLAENIAALMRHGGGPKSQPELKVKSGVAQATIGRMLKGTQSARIDSVDAVARAYGFAGWQLLVPNLDPENPPTMRVVSAKEQALYDRVLAAALDLAKHGVGKH